MSGTGTPTADEAVLIDVRCARSPATLAVAALADVAVERLAAALAVLLDADPRDGWALGPDDAVAAAWPPGSTLRELGVLDGSSALLQPVETVSGARS